MHQPNYLFLVARLPIGFSLLGHGLVRFPKLEAFSNSLVSSFSNSLLPSSFVRIFSYALPFAEFIIGLCIVLGLYTRPALAAGIILMSLLIFGSSTIEKWDAVAIQLVHAAYLVLVFTQVGDNPFSLDRLLKR